MSDTCKIYNNNEKLEYDPNMTSVLYMGYNSASHNVCYHKQTDNFLIHLNCRYLQAKGR